MEKRHQKIITKHLTLLQQGIIPLAEFYAGLLEKEVFTDEMVEQIQASSTKGEQVFQMLRLLKSRGPQALPNFIQVLETTGHEDLANKLREAMAQAENGATNHSHRKVDEFITKHLQRLHKLLSQEERKVLSNNLVLKEELQEERNLKESQEEQCAWQTVEIQTLQKDVQELNKKLNTSLDVNKNNQVKISQLQQRVTAQQIAIAEKDEEIGELTERLELASTVKRPESVEVTDFNHTREEQETQIKLLKEKLQMQEGQFEKMQENLKGQIQTRDSKIVEINEQLENIRGKAGDDLDLLEMNNNMSEGDKNVLLLQINIDFLTKRIETLDSQLTSAHQTVDNLREEEEMCQQILGFPLDEQYSLHSSIRRMMEENSIEKQSLQERISSLKGKLKTLRQEKDSLQIKLQGAELDKEMLKNSIKHMKHKFIDVRFNPPSRESSASSQSNDSLGDKLPELPASSFRLNTLHKSTSAPRLASYATPRIVNVSYAGSTNHGRLKTRHGSLSDTPATLEHSVCVVCRQEYKEADNHDRACRFHLKPYKEFNFEKSKRWQCCFKSAETAAGCSFGKHTSKLTYW